MCAREALPHHQSGAEVHPQDAVEDHAEATFQHDLQEAVQIQIERGAALAGAGRAGVPGAQAASQGDQAVAQAGGQPVGIGLAEGGEEAARAPEQGEQAGHTGWRLQARDAPATKRGSASKYSIPASGCQRCEVHHRISYFEGPVASSKDLTVY